MRPANKKSTLGDNPHHERNKPMTTLNEAKYDEVIAAAIKVQRVRAKALAAAGEIADLIKHRNQRMDSDLVKLQKRNPKLTTLTPKVSNHEQEITDLKQSLESLAFPLGQSLNTVGQMCTKALEGDEDSIRRINNINIGGILKDKETSLIEEKCQEWEEMKLLSDM
jgi:hypothetical protein